MSRIKQGWIKYILDSTKEFESPEIYYYWSALAVLSAAVGKNVYWDKFAYKLYPNIYVFLVGDSGIRKGLPISISKKLVEALKTKRVISGRNTIQSIIRSLSKAETMEGVGLLDKAQGLIVSGEFANLLVDDDFALTALTELHNVHENELEWKNTLKGILLGPSLTKSSVGGGFVARSFFVYANAIRCVNSLMAAPENIVNIDKLMPHLRSVAQLKGPFQPTDMARARYDGWYRDFHGKRTEDKTGTAARIHEQVLKVAMLLSLAEREDLVVTPDHIDEALDRCVETVQGMKHIVMGSGQKAETADPTATVIKFLLERENYEATRQKILQAHWGDFDYVGLDKIVETLFQAGIITIKRTGIHITYTLTPKAIETYEAHTKEIM